MTNKTERITVTTASTGLCLYSFYKFITSFFDLFGHLQSVTMTTGEKISYLLNGFISTFDILIFGICGFLLIYSEYVEKKDIDIRNRFFLVKKIVFSLFVLLSSGSIIRMGYYFFTSLEPFQRTLDQVSHQGEPVFPYIFSMIVMPFGILVPIGSILFGLFILQSKENLRRPGFLLFLTGSVVSMISRTYTFTRSMILYIKISDKFELYGISMNQIYKSILLFTVNILLIAAGLIVVRYGSKKIMHLKAVNSIHLN
ncbi:MAG: hypothetical protein ACYC5K_06435 [Saccharofermentanales bacterium]